MRATVAGLSIEPAPRLTAGARCATALIPADTVVTVPVLEAGGGLTPQQPLTPQQVIIAGERAGDVSEHEYLRS